MRDIYRLKQNLYDEGGRIETPALAYERRVRNTLGSKFPTQHVMMKTEEYTGDIDAVVSKDLAEIAVETKLRKSRVGRYVYNPKTGELSFRRYDRSPDMGDRGINRQMREYLGTYPAFVLVTNAGPSEYYFTREGKPCAICRYRTYEDRERLYGVIESVAKRVEKKTG